MSIGTTQNHRNVTLLRAPPPSGLAPTRSDDCRIVPVRIYRFVFESIITNGVFNGDPHPGNYLFDDDGRVTFLDFGCVKYFRTT